MARSRFRFRRPALWTLAGLVALDLGLATAATTGVMGPLAVSSAPPVGPPAIALATPATPPPPPTTSTTLVEVPATTLAPPAPTSPTTSSPPPPSTTTTSSPPPPTTTTTRSTGHLRPTAAVAPTPLTAPDPPPEAAEPPPAPEVVARRVPSRAEVEAAIEGFRPYFRSLMPVSPSHEQVADLGDKICTALDEDQSIAEIKATGRKMADKVPFASLREGGEEYILRTAVALFCPGHAPKLA